MSQAIVHLCGERHRHAMSQCADVEAAELLDVVRTAERLQAVLSSRCSYFCAACKVWYRLRDESVAHERTQQHIQQVHRQHREQKVEVQQVPICCVRSSDCDQVFRCGLCGCQFQEVDEATQHLCCRLQQQRLASRGAPGPEGAPLSSPVLSIAWVCTFSSAISGLNQHGGAHGASPGGRQTSA